MASWMAATARPTCPSTAGARPVRTDSTKSSTSGRWRFARRRVRFGALDLADLHDHVPAVQRRDADRSRASRTDRACPAGRRRRASPPASPVAPRSNCSSAAAVSSTSRSSAIVETRLVTRRTGPSRCDRTSIRWQPKSAIGPPPACDRSISHDRGSPGCGSNGSKAIICANTGVPISPDVDDLLHPRDHRIEAAVVRHAERRRRWRGRRRSYDRIRRRSIAIGFSQSTCLPASAAAMVCSA